MKPVTPVISVIPAKAGTQSLSLAGVQNTPPWIPAFYHLVYRHAFEVAPDGVTLAKSSTTGGLWVSADAGEHWQCLSRDLPPVAVLKFAG